MHALIQMPELEQGFHYNPRFADSNWLKKHPEYRSGIVRKKDRSYVHEEYKDHDHFFMNPNDERWFERSMKTIKYLSGLGFDYVQLDQFTYQRNFYNPHQPIQLGFKKMIEECNRLGIKHWLEGVSDVHKLKPGNFYQILIRDIPLFRGKIVPARGLRDVLIDALPPLVHDG